MAVNNLVTYPVEGTPARVHEPEISAITLDGISHVYSSGTQALENVSFNVPQGKIFGLLGPNGAGKTTLIRVMCGLLVPTAGQTRIFNQDILRSSKTVRRRLCAHLQSTPVSYRTRVEELLRLFSTFYKHPMDVDELLHLVGLVEKRREFWERLSEGQKQRLMIARALVGNPDLLVLDEPTTGLDVAMRHDLHDLIRRLREQGRTIVISTHYMEEAEHLCDRVAVLYRGRLFAVDAPEVLVRQYTHGERLEINLSSPPSMEELRSIPGLREVRKGESDASYSLVGIQGERMLQHLVVMLLKTDVRLREARVVRPNLEEAYLQLTRERIPS